MIFQNAVETSSSHAFGRITTDAIEREIRIRGIYVIESVPITHEPPVVLGEPPTAIITPAILPEILPRPEDKVVVLPGDREKERELIPWLPRYPIVPEPELEELYTPPYTEELIMPLTPTVGPEAKPESKVALILIIGIVALVALTNGKGKQPTIAKSRAV